MSSDAGGVQEVAQLRAPVAGTEMNATGVADVEDAPVLPEATTRMGALKTWPLLDLMVTI